MRKHSIVFFLSMVFGSAMCFAEASDVSVNRRIPNEYETVGGYGLGLGNNAVASTEGLAAIRVNPALLSLDRTYSVGAGYNWPVEGREFFQAGVVDSKSASIAAGFVYTGFTDDYSTDLETFEKDSPVKRRAAFGLAQNMGLFAAGIGGQFVEATDTEDPFNRKAVKGTALNFGLSGLLTPMIRVGASVENLANKKIAAYAPRTVRAGLAVLFGGGNLITNLDFRQRDRVEQLEQGYRPLFDDGFSAAERDELEKEDKEYQQPERMAFASAIARVYDNIRLLGSYGQTLSGPARKSLSGGVAIISGNFSLSYSASRPYMSEPEAQQAVNAAFAINL